MAVQFARKNADGSDVSFPVVRGNRWQERILLTDQATGLAVDLTGVTDIVMRLRRTMNSPVALELSMTNGYLIVADELGGEVDIDVPSLTVNTLPANKNKPTRYLFDMEIQRSADEWEPAIAGTVRVTTSVTRKLDDTP